VHQIAGTNHDSHIVQSSRRMPKDQRRLDTSRRSINAEAKLGILKNRSLPDEISFLYTTSKTRQLFYQFHEGNPSSKNSFTMQKQI
jgi:hypothetical protein